jgi:hypothetical protein
MTQKSKKEDAPPRKRQFTWPRPMADRVYSKVRGWHMVYDNGRPVNPRKMPHPRYGEDAPITVTTRYKHQIPFNLNELQWMAETFTEENPDTSVARIMTLAKDRHLKAQEQQVIGVGAEWEQEYDLEREEVFYMKRLLERIMLGRPTPMQIKEEKRRIESSW